MFSKKKISLVILIFIFLQLFNMNSEELNLAENNPKDWKLVWSDEFEGSKTDTAKWTFDLGNGFFTKDSWINGWGNNELEYYTNEPKNVIVNDGKLIITALKERIVMNEQIYNYSSARLKTKGLYSLKYGRIEAKIKLPSGKGLWPTFWMLPEKEIFGKWAASGEIDIMEARGSNICEVSGAIHFGGEWPKNVYSTEKYIFPANQYITAFHLYAIEWYPDEIKWYVDGKCYFKIGKWYSQSPNKSDQNLYPAPFNENFFILINLAVGGNYDGAPDEKTIFPQKMEVDYVRVYQKN